MSFTADTHFANYTPREGRDAAPELYHARLVGCTRCTHRQGHRCTVAGQLCSVLARPAAGACPNRTWPGDQPKIETAPAAAVLPPASVSPPDVPAVRAGRTIAVDTPRVKGAATVSIVIAARNNGPYLAESIESALRQTVPCEVIYSDDCSADDSLDIARRYAGRGLIIIESSTHRGPASARRRGFEIASGDWFINLDGDDIMPPAYVEKMLAAVRHDTPFAYGSAQAFGTDDSLWPPPTWGQKSLWLRNFVNTSAMYSRTAYHAAGGWQDSIGTMWDWDLALRASRFGTPRKSAAVLMYRIHPESFSHLFQERTEADILRFLEKMRRRHARLSVGSIISGRLRNRFPAWLDRLACATRQAGAAGPVDLVLLDHSNDEGFAAIMRREAGRHADTFDTVRILDAGPPLTWQTEPERQDAVCRFMAASCNRLKAALRGDVHWIVEDDVFPRLDAGEKLLTALVAGLRPPEAASGVYLNRHVADRIVGGWWKENGPEEPTAAGLAAASHHSPLVVDFCGTGCVMYWRDRVPDFEPRCRGAAAHDWAWSMEIGRRGGQVWLLPDVACGHATDDADGMLSLENRP